MGNNDQRFLNIIEPLIEEHLPKLIMYHGKKNAYKVIQFAKLFASLGRTEEAKDIILKAVNLNWEHNKKCQKQTKLKSLSGYLSRSPLLELSLNLLKKLLK